MAYVKYEGEILEDGGVKTPNESEITLLTQMLNEKQPTRASKQYGGYTPYDGEVIPFEADAATNKSQSVLQDLGVETTTPEKRRVTDIGLINKMAEEAAKRPSVTKVLKSGFEKPSLFTSEEGEQRYQSNIATGRTFSQEEIDKMPLGYRSLYNIANYASDPLTAGFSVAQQLYPPLRTAGVVSGILPNIVKGTVPSLGAEEGMRVARENDLGSGAELGFGLVGGLTGGVAQSALGAGVKAGSTAAVRGSDTLRALKSFFGSSDYRLVQRAMQESGGNLLDNINKLADDAKAIGVELPPAFALIQTNAGFEEVAKRLGSDPQGVRIELMNAFDELGAAMHKQIGAITAPQTSISDAYKLSLKEYKKGYRQWNAVDQSQYSAFVNQKLEPYNQVMSKFDEAQDRILDGFTNGTASSRQVVEQLKAVEGNRRVVANKKSNELYSDAYQMAERDGVAGKPTVESVQGLEQMFRTFEKDGVFKDFVGNSRVQDAAAKVFGRELKQGLLSADGKPLTNNSTIRLEDLHDLRKSLSSLYNTDPYRYKQLVGAIDQAIETIPNKSVVKAFKDAQAFNSTKIQAPKDMEAFNRLTPEQLDATVEANFGSRQSLEEFLAVNDFSDNSIKVADAAVRRFIFNKITDESGNVVDGKVKAFFSHPDNKDYISVLPKEQREVLEQSGSSLAEANKLAAMQRQHIEEVKKTIAEDVFKTISGASGVKYGLDHVAETVLGNPSLRDDIFSQLRNYESKTGNKTVTDALKLKITEKAFNQADPWGFINSDLHRELFQKLYGKKEFESLRGLSNLSMAYDKMGNTLRGTKVSPNAIPPNLEVPGTGQSVQSVISLMFQPFYSPLYASSAFAARTARNWLTNADKAAGKDILTNTDAIIRLTQARQSGETDVFLKELAKMYQRYNAVKDVYQAGAVTATGFEDKQ